MLPDQIRDWVRHDFGINLTRLEPITLGADNRALTWRVTTPTGGTYAVKWTSGGSTAGSLASRHLTEAGITGVVAPVHTTDGDLWSNRDGRRLIVTPWVSGDRAVEHRMTEPHWRSFGTLLAEVHAAPLPTSLHDVLPEEDFSHARLSAVTQAVDHGLRSNVLSADETVQALAKEWRAGLAAQIDVLLAGADDLGCRLRAESHRHVLCHGDPHLGNVLVLDGTPWLLDWDDAMLAPPERDLVLLKGGMNAYGPVNRHEQTWFDAGYGTADIDPVLLAYYRCTRAIEDTVGFVPDILDLDRPPAERAELLEIIRDVAGPTGLVTLALSSLPKLGRSTADESWPSVRST